MFRPKTELEIFKESMGDQALIQLRMDRRRERDDKKETKLIKSLVGRLNIGN